MVRSLESRVNRTKGQPESAGSNGEQWEFTFAGYTGARTNRLCGAFGRREGCGSGRWPEALAGCFRGSTGLEEDALADGAEQPVITALHRRALGADSDAVVPLARPDDPAMDLAIRACPLEHAAQQRLGRGRWAECPLHALARLRRVSLG